jgi:hypothetical protein
VSDLAGALDAALSARYPRQEVKTPITWVRGRHYRMNQIEKLFTRPGDRKGAAVKRAAEAAGIPVRTWRDWRAGKGASARNLRKLETAHNRMITIPAFRQKVNSTPVPDLVNISATIVWNGYKNKTEHRSTKLDGMRRVMRAVIRAWSTAGPEAAAEALERGAASVYNEPTITFEGNDVEVDFP